MRCSRLQIPVVTRSLLLINTKAMLVRQRCSVDNLARVAFTAGIELRSGVCIGVDRQREEEEGRGGEETHILLKMEVMELERVF
jgi:hypothetical protein